jgi:succinate dehydrogenase hydrophobic anchor subunit
MTSSRISVHNNLAEANVLFCCQTTVSTNLYTMIRAALVRSPAFNGAASAARRKFAAPSGPLEADAGGLATHTYHAITTSLLALAPAYFLVPDSYTDGILNKVFGVGISAVITAHSWIGMNYVCTDYVPKVSRALLGPSRIFNAGLAVVTFLGLSRIAVASPGGIKGCVKGLWNPPKKE